MCHRTSIRTQSAIRRAFPSLSVLTQMRSFVPGGLPTQGNTLGMPMQQGAPGVFPVMPSMGTGNAPVNPFMSANVFSQAKPAPVSSAPAQPSVADGPAESAEAPKSDGEPRFTCAMCDKSFRLESALIHHMKIKHNEVVAPGSQQPASGGAPEPPMSEEAKEKEKYIVDKAAGVNDFVSPESTNSEYAEKVRAAKQKAASALPPEEVTIACHSSCINSIVLVGKMVDVQSGYVWEDRVFQFSIVCPFRDPPSGESDRDTIIVRYHLGDGEDARAQEKVFRALADDGKNVCVMGNIRMNPQLEKVNSRYYYYPLVYVSPSCGSIQALE